MLSRQKLLRGRLFFGAFVAATLTAPSSAHAGQKLGDVITNLVNSFSNAPDVLAATSYLLGLVLGCWAVFKFKDHVDSPGQVPLSEGVKKLLAGGMFLALPMAMTAMVNTLTKGIANASLGGKHSGVGGGGQSLDAVAVAVMSSVSGPLGNMLSAFSYLSGIALALIGINRLTKSSQEGPRGPGGIGTIMTFVSAGALMSAGSMMGAFSSSLFNSSDVKTFSALQDPVASSLDPIEIERVQSVIDACLAFLIFVGWIAFLRGWFVLRSVADGNSQASMMQAFTFLFGGALAVNLGPLINAIQETLGIAAAGVVFN